MPNSIFFAWQSDTNPSENRTFIWNAIVDACKVLANNSVPEQSPRPEKDTIGVSGSPNIVQTIFRKIDHCAMFIADVTFVAKSEKSRLVPNPNVLLELGYAVKTVGWERTILVLNSACGKADSLPFDMLQHRWPIEYKITSETKAREKRWSNLKEALSVALQSCEEYSLNRATDMMNSLDADCLKLIADNESNRFIVMQLPANNMAGLLIGGQRTASLRRLMDLAALKVVEKPHIGYGWTNDGLLMVREINRTHPDLLNVLRVHN